MAKVAQVAKAALQRILVQASESPLEASEYQDFIFSMNNFMLDLDARGVSLGYTEVSDLGDDVTIPTGALRGLIANMAIEVAPDYGGEISQGLALAASAGMKTMIRLGNIITQTEYPATLPRGSGNWDSGSGLQSNYYPALEADILAETTGAIGLELSTE